MDNDLPRIILAMRSLSIQRVPLLPAPKRANHIDNDNIPLLSHIRLHTREYASQFTVVFERTHSYASNINISTFHIDSIKCAEAIS